MKKTLIALAALGVVGAASAQVAISGSAMVALQKGSKTATTTSFATPDFDVNFSANEDLGGGLSVAVATGITTNGGRGSHKGLTTTTVSAAKGSTTTNEHYSMAVSGGFGEIKYANLLSGTAKMSAGESIEHDVSDEMGGYYNVLSFKYTAPSISGFTVAVDWTTKELATGAINPAHPTTTGAANIGLTYQLDGLTVYWENGAAAKSNDVRVTYDAGIATLMGRTKTGGTTEWAVTAPVGALTAGVHYGKNGTGNATAGVVSYALSKQTSLKFSYLSAGGGGADWRLGLSKTF